MFLALGGYGRCLLWFHVILVAVTLIIAVAIALAITPVNIHWIGNRSGRFSGPTLLPTKSPSLSFPEAFVVSYRLGCNSFLFG